MQRLLMWFNRIIKKNKELKRWQRIVTALAAVITFATTYALILPAITVEMNKTEEVGGMYLEQEEAQDELLEENAPPFTGVAIAADQGNAVSFSYADDDMTATAIFSTDEEIPEGAELVVNPVDPESEEYAELSGRAVVLLDKEFIYDVTTCSFYNYALICDGLDVTPETGLVDVQIEFLNNTVEHIDDSLFAGRFARPAAQEGGFVMMSADDVDAAVDTLDVENEPDEAAYSSDVRDELISENPDESSVIELSDGIITVLSLKGNDLAQNDSIVGILAGNVDEDARAAAADTDAEIPDYNGPQEKDAPVDSAEVEGETAPAVKTLKAAGKDYTVVLTYDETSGIPAEAYLTASEIAQDSKEYQTYLRETKKAMGFTEEETLPRFAARFFDIKIMVGDDEFTPETGVSVEITYAEPLAEEADAEVSAVHFAEKAADAEVIEANTTEVQDDGAATVKFAAESFSVYGVIYTVDFHWEVNGKTYEFRLPGGGFVSFEALMEVLGVADPYAASGEETEEAIAAFALNDIRLSEETKQFVNDVEKVEFSSPDLVWVGKAEEDISVGELKDANHLQVEYSADLTEEQIEEINAQMVRSGDWALISLKTFNSEEFLTVTMKNGDQFDIRVTDPATTNPRYTMISRSNMNVNTREDGIIIKLFDYSGTVSSGGTNRNIDAVWGGNNYTALRQGWGVNNGRTLVFSGSGMNGNETFNNFTGTNSYGDNGYYSGYRYPGLVKNELVGGYPELNPDTVTLTSGDDGNLGYLFGAGGQQGVTEYSANGQGLLGLLRKDSDGYYYYDSENNYARLDSANEYIDLYTDTYFKDKGADIYANGGRGSIGFFPFTDYDPSHKEEKGPNIPNNLYYNHQLGMTLEAYFSYPPNGKLNDEHGTPMTFEFTGDDDVWVYVDGKLAMDLGGVHQPIRGLIDFNAQKVYIYEYDSYDTSGNHPKVERLTKTITFDELFGEGGYDDTPYSTHTINFFFLERGGCDSNCALKFNLITLATADKTFSKVDGENAGLPGATFALYTDEACTQPLSVENQPVTAVSGADGSVHLENIPVRTDANNTPIVYYMKETDVPFGFKKNNTVYKLVYNSSTKTYNVLTLNNTSSETVVNTPVEPIELSVEKQWQDAAGNPVTPENSYSATFVLHRLRSYTTEDEVVTGSETTLRIRHVRNDTGGYDNFSSFGEQSYQYLRGRTVTINYDYHGTTSNSKRQYRYSTNNGSTWTYSANLPETGSFDVIIPNSGQYLLEFYDVNNAVTWTVDPHAAQGENVTDETDPTFSCDPISLTNGQTSKAFNSGRYTGTPDAGKFPVCEIVNNVQYRYTYYITEESSTPSNILPVYFDGSGNVVANPSTIATESGGPQTIANRLPMEIPIEKYWPDFNDGQHSWTATFQLQSRLIDPDTGNAVTNWRDLDGMQKDISSGESGQGAFTGLQMYQLHEGKLHRIEYSVAEIAYTVRDLSNNSVVAQWQDPEYYNNPVETIGVKYSPQFVQDAGEHGASVNDYRIIVANTPENRVTTKTINITLHKTWPRTDLADSDDAEARFVLKRYVYEEYRDFPTGTQEWVDITLDTGNGSPQTLHVPKNWQMTILGNFKDKSTSGNIVFHDNGNNTDIVVTPEDYEDRHFYKTFIADQTKTIRLISGVGYAAGGANGIRLSDMDDPDDTNTSHPDSGFAIPFTLDKDNNWQNILYNLPVIEEDKHTADALNITRYVYGYYIEEISCVPEDYSAKFKDGDGYLLGDEENTIDFGSTVTAENRLKPGSLKLTKIVTVNGGEPTSSTTQFVDDTYYFTIAGKPGTDTADEPIRTVPVTVSGGQASTVEVEDLMPGEYIVTEVDPLNGTELVSENGVTAIVVTDMTDDATPDSAKVEMTNNRELTELRVRKAWAAASPSDHPTDVAFKIYRIGYYMEGGERRPASEGFYPDSNRVYMVYGANEAHVPNLPVHDVESVAGINRWVTYEYHVMELPVEGDTTYWPTYSVNGTNVTITNTPVEEPDHKTDVSVTKVWLDKEGASVPALHENDKIEFALKEIPHSTGYVPIHLIYINADGTTWKQQEVFVKYNERLNFTFRKGETLFSHQIEITEGSGHMTVGGSESQYNYRTSRLTDETTITLNQRFSYTAILGGNTYYDRWGDEVENLGYAYQWTSDVEPTGGTLYEDYASFYNAMKGNQAGEANEFFYQLSKDDITTEEGPYEGRMIENKDWATIFEDLPEYQKVGDEFMLLTYEISELKIIPYGMDEESVGTSSFDNYQGETTNYLVNWEPDGDSWTVTNREKPGIDITIRKTDVDGQALGGAVFELYRKSGTVFAKVTHTAYNWLDNNDRFTVPDEGFQMTGLKDGMYQIMEVASPRGYVITDRTPVTFEVEHCAVVENSNELTDGVSYEPAAGSAKDTYIIPNKPGAALPMTGGSGTRVFTITGLIAVILAGIILVRRKKYCLFA